MKGPDKSDYRDGETMTFPCRTLVILGIDVPTHASAAPDHPTIQLSCSCVPIPSSLCVLTEITDFVYETSRGRDPLALCIIERRCSQAVPAIRT